MLARDDRPLAKRRLYAGLAVALIVLALGFAIRVSSGFRAAPATDSVTRWLGLVFGAAALLWRATAAWIETSDRLTDPRWLRFLHWGTLLALWGAFALWAWTTVSVAGE